MSPMLPIQPEGNLPRILVVDDEVIVQQVLGEVLAEEGYVVEAVAHAREALAKLGGNNYSLILLDIKMSGMSGIEFYQHLQQTASPLAGKVVFITGDVLSADTLSFLQKSKAPFLTKPFDNEQLKRKVNRILCTVPSGA